MSGKGTVVYQWETSDGETSGEERLTFAAPGSRTVEIDLELSDSYSGWVQLQIMEPHETVSNQAEVAVTCAAP